MYMFLDGFVLHIWLHQHMGCFVCKEVGILSSIQMAGSHKLPLSDIQHLSDSLPLYMRQVGFLQVLEDSSKQLYVLQPCILLYHHIVHLYMGLYTLC